MRFNMSEKTRREIKRVKIDDYMKSLTKYRYEQLTKLLNDGWHILQINDVLIEKWDDEGTPKLISIYHLTREVEATKDD